MSVRPFVPKKGGILYSWRDNHQHCHLWWISSSVHDAVIMVNIIIIRLRYMIFVLKSAEKKAWRLCNNRTDPSSPIQSAAPISPHHYMSDQSDLHLFGIFLVLLSLYFIFFFCILAHFNLLKSAAPIRMCVWNNSDFHVFEHVFFLLVFFACILYMSFACGPGRVKKKMM